MGFEDVTPILRWQTLTHLVPAIFAGLLVLGCGDRTAEPEGGPRPTEPAVKPLGFTAPDTWTRTESSDTGAKRAAYRVPRVGTDTEDAELLVLFYGTGSHGDRDKAWDSWLGQFDGDAKSAAKREAFDVPSGKVETFEVTGTFKINVGPHKPGATSSPVQMVKKDFRMIGVVVRTGDRGNWFFRLVGPDATVAAHAAELRAMLEGAK